MILFPAIDLKNGQVVRLKQGDYQQVTSYETSPLEQAQAWKKAGAEWLHIVDLDAAKSGQATHQDIICEIAEKTKLKIQIGGGIRSFEMAENYLNNGIARVIVGTQAIKEPSFLSEMGGKFPGKIALGLDTKDGKISIQGWTETTNRELAHFLQNTPLTGIACLIFTDIARDGMLEGPNLKALNNVANLSPIPVIASGGVSSLADLKAIQDLKHDNILGAIVGKALYENAFSLKDALEVFEGI